MAKKKQGGIDPVLLGTIGFTLIASYLLLFTSLGGFVAEKLSEFNIQPTTTTTISGSGNAPNSINDLDYETCVQAGLTGCKP